MGTLVVCPLCVILLFFFLFYHNISISNLMMLRVSKFVDTYAHLGIPLVQLFLIRCKVLFMLLETRTQPSSSDLSKSFHMLRMG